MTTAWPVGNVPYIALQEGGRRSRVARPHLPADRCPSYAIVLGGEANLAVSPTLASTFAAGGGVTATGGCNDQANAPTAPDGTAAQAVRVRETTATSTHWLRWTPDGYPTPADQFVCASIYVKAAGRTTGRIAVCDTADFSTLALEADFDLSAGTIAYVQSAGDFVIAGMGIENVGGDWFRLHIAVRSEVRAAAIFFKNGSGATFYAGNVNNGMDVWGAQIELGVTSPRPPQQNGAKTAMHPYINRNALVLPYDLSNTNGWTLTNMTATALAPQRAPHGHLSGFFLAETTANGEHRISQTFTSGLANVVTASVYVRGVSTTARDCVMRITTSGGAWAQVSAKLSGWTTNNNGGPLTGTATSSGAVQILDYGLEYLNDGWLRLRLTATGSGVTWNTFTLYASSGGQLSYAGNTAQGLQVSYPEVIGGHYPSDTPALPDPPAEILTDNGVRVRLLPGGEAACYADLNGLSRSYYFEVTVVEMTTSEARIGVVTPGSGQNGANLGQVSQTWGLRPNGNIENNTIVVGTGPTFAQGDTIGVCMRWDASSNRYNMHLVKNPSGAFALPAASIANMLNNKLPAIARVGNQTPVVLDFNLGERPWKGVPPAGFSALTADLADQPRSFSTASMLVEDLPNYRSANQSSLRAFPVALGRIATRPAIKRAVSCWVWGRGQRQQTPNVIDLDNSDGALDELAAFQNRDRVVALHVIPAAPFVTVQSTNRAALAVVDGITADGGTLRITSRDLKELLTVPIQATTFPTTVANAAVHGKPRPITLGEVRWVPVVMRDGPNLDFEFHDSLNFAQLVELRQNGAVLTLNTDYATPGAGGAFGFRRLTAVQGKQAARVRGQTDQGSALIERLPGLLTWIAVTKTGRLTASQLDTAGTITALDTAAPYKLGRYISPDEPLMASALVQEIMDSFCGDVYTDKDGKLAVWRLEPPAGAPAFRWTEADMLAPIVRTPDTAPGLTTTIGFARNYAQHSTGELAGSVQNATVGSELSLAFQSRTAAVALAAPYAQAAAAPPMVTLLTDAAQAQAEIDRVATIYAVPRFFYDVQVMIDAADVLAVQPGTIVNLRAPTLDLEAGKSLAVVSVEAQLGANAATLRLWG